MKKYIFIILVIFLLSSPVSANVTYPEEYYTLQNKSSVYELFILDLIDDMKITNNMWDAKSYLILHYDIERQNILLEKQNELQADLVKAQWVETCYALDKNVNMGNRSAWKSECANVGYPVG